MEKNNKRILLSLLWLLLPLINLTLLTIDNRLWYYCGENCLRPAFGDIGIEVCLILTFIPVLIFLLTIGAVLFQFIRTVIFLLIHKYKRCIECFILFSLMLIIIIPWYFRDGDNINHNIAFLKGFHYAAKEKNFDINEIQNWLKPFQIHGLGNMNYDRAVKRKSFPDTLASLPPGTLSLDISDKGKKFMILSYRKPALEYGFVVGVNSAEKTQYNFGHRLDFDPNGFVWVRP